MPDTILDTILTAGWREGAPEATVLRVRPECIRRMGAPRDVPAVRGALLDATPDKDRRVPAVGKWAVVVLAKDKDAAVDALSPLIEHRRNQGWLWRDGIIAVDPSVSDTGESWDRRLRTAVGKDVEPPYYLLLAGGPDRLSFSMQCHLGLEYATGRLDVTDTPGGGFSWEACRRYAVKVVDYELGRIEVDRKPLFYSPGSDDKTKVSHQYLIEPLAGKIPGGVTSLYGTDATTGNLEKALSGQRAPKLVFTASHGVEFPSNPLRWGALTDSNYGGRPDDPVLSVETAASHDRFAYGSIIFAFACFSGGVPAASLMWFLAGESETAITANLQKVAPLPRYLLGHPMGPVAFVGHVDRVSAAAFQSSFGMRGIEPYEHFVSWLRYSGGTVGRALETLRENARLVGARISTTLAEAARDTANIPTVRAAGRMWVDFFDYHNFILLGDPALTPAPEA